MLSLTRKSDYALLAMTELARCAPEKASTRSIAEACQLHLPVLTNIMHQLMHSGLVVSARGSRGGYSLSRSADEITLADVIEAIEGPVKLALCCSETDGCEESTTDSGCELADNCKIKAPVQRVHQGLRDFLNQVALTHIAFDQVPVTLGIRS